MGLIEPASHLSDEARQFLADFVPLPPLDPTDLDAVETARRMSLANWVALNEGLEGPWISRPSTIAGVPVVTFAVDEHALGAEQVMVHLHGGAFVLGSPTASTALAVGMAQRTGMPVVSVDYRLAPEHRCPAGLIDIVNVCRDVLASRRLESALRRAGVPVELSVWDGLWHGWQLRHHLPEAGKALDELAVFLTGSHSRRLSA